ncbi:MAG: sulfite exporter TauE/SafE family protein [Clostridia bacterium]|nr:sulfite exporter TauE/SafE family protein [Clostridia bacterium]
MNKSGILGIVTGFANGFFGAGGGTILVPGMERILKTEEHKAHATAIAVILPLSVISALIYVFKVNIPWQALLYVCIGGIPGGYTGAKILSKFSGKWLHIIFGGFMLIAAAKMVIK